jgi:hypothetical protein
MLSAFLEDTFQDSVAAPDLYISSIRAKQRYLRQTFGRFVICFNSQMYLPLSVDTTYVLC